MQVLAEALGGGYTDVTRAREVKGDVPTHLVTLTQIGTSVYLGRTHLGNSIQFPAWVRKFSLGSTGGDHFFRDVTSLESDIPQ